MRLNNKDLVEKIISRTGVKNQAKLSEILGVSANLITEWKKNRSNPSLEQLDVIVEKTGISWTELLTGKNPTWDKAFDGVKPTQEPETLAEMLLPVLRQQVDDLRSALADKERLIAEKDRRITSLELLIEALKGKK